MEYTFSPSSLSLLKECPRCFWLRFKKDIRRPSGPFPSLPSGMDLLFKKHFDSFRKKGKLPPELSELKGPVKLFDDLDLLKTWRNNRKGLQWMNRKENVLRGAVDEILQKRNKLIVLDYKTRGFPLKENSADYYQDQLDIYTFLLRKNGYNTENYAYLLFIHPNKIKTKGDIVFHTDLIRKKISVKNAENIFKKALKIVNGKIPKSSKDCEFCDWVSSCSKVTKIKGQNINHF